jgi:hypothetical protein
LTGPQNQSGRGDEEKNSQHLPGLEALIIQPIAQRYITELSWLIIIDFGTLKSTRMGVIQ